MVDWSEIPKDRRHARSHSTRESILFAAERLFAENGIGSVSLRDIGLAAGQKNNGAVQYHFGDRDNLVAQIASYREGAIEAARRDLLTRIGEASGHPTVRDYVSAFVRSLASLLADEQNHFLQFLSRYFVERGRSPLGVQPPGTYEGLRGTMLALLPHLDPPILVHRWRLMTITAIHALASYQTTLRTSPPGLSPAGLIAELIDFLTAGLEAPVSHDARREDTADAAGDADWNDWI